MKSRQDLHLSPAARRPSAKAYGSSTAITNATAICRSIFSAAGSCFWRNCVPRTSTCESHSRNHPAQAPEAWSAGDGQRAAHQDRHRVRLPHEGRVRECSPATMFRRLNWRTRPVPHQRDIAEVQAPGSPHRRESHACQSKGCGSGRLPWNKNSGITTLVRNAG